jgi:hypothetical protein
VVVGGASDPAKLGFGFASNRLVVALTPQSEEQLVLTAGAGEIVPARAREPQIR